MGANNRHFVFIDDCEDYEDRLDEFYLERFTKGNVMALAQTPNDECVCRIEIMHAIYEAVDQYEKLLASYRNKIVLSEVRISAADKEIKRLNKLLDERKNSKEGS